MNLIQALQNNKPTIVATYALAREAALNAGFTLQDNIKDTCKSAGVNRTQVYEKKLQIRNNLELIEHQGPGRPSMKKAGDSSSDWTCTQLLLKVTILEYRLAHPGAVVTHSPFRTTYSNTFKRFVLGLWDGWKASDNEFSCATGVPFRTLQGWRSQDEKLFEGKRQQPPQPKWPKEPNEACRLIANDYTEWEGNTREFLKHEAAKLNIPAAKIAAVLRIAGMISPKQNRPPRYRGSTLNATAGAIIVTDGKKVTVDLTGSQKQQSFNWQGIVDQATACHTAVVITDTECATGISTAYEQTVKFLGKAPLALLHDNKPIHQEEKLRQTVTEKSVMIPATPRRPENKAVLEGEFGKFQQQVGAIQLDDSDKDSLVKSAVGEVIRAYTAGINHAGRFEFNGKSRIEVVRKACPDPEKDQQLIAKLKASHIDERPTCGLPSQPVSRRLLDAGYQQFNLTASDPQGKTRQWLSKKYTPEAIRQAFAIFGAKIEACALKGKLIHRYLIKVIQNCQDEISLRAEEAILRKFAEIERTAWIELLEQESHELQEEMDSNEELATSIAERALFGSIAIERSYWESRLRSIILHEDKDFTSSLCKYIRRIYEADKNDRFQLLSKIIGWERDLDIKC